VNRFESSCRAKKEASQKFGKLMRSLK